MIIQQMCIIVYLVSTLLQNILSIESSESLADFGNNLSSLAKNGQSLHIISKGLVQLVQSFAYYEYYFMSMMHSLDLYKIVCHPLKYDDFKETRNIIKLISYGSVICFVSSGDHVVSVAIGLTLNKDTNDAIENKDLIRNMSLAVHIGNAVKIVLLKTYYSVSIPRMAVLTRKGLKQSENMSNRNDKQSAHHRLFLFTLIPLLLSFLFTIKEIIIVGKPFIETLDSGCSPHWLHRKDVTLVISTALFTFGSFTYFAGYIALFPKIREIFKNIFRCSRE